MSPTSYQAAPPRVTSSCLDRARNLIAAVRKVKTIRHPEDHTAKRARCEAQRALALPIGARILLLLHGGGHQIWESRTSSERPSAGPSLHSAPVRKGSLRGSSPSEAGARSRWRARP